MHHECKHKGHCYNLECTVTHRYGPESNDVEKMLKMGTFRTDVSIGLLNKQPPFPWVSFWLNPLSAVSFWLLPFYPHCQLSAVTVFGDCCHLYCMHSVAAVSICSHSILAMLFCLWYIVMMLRNLALNLVIYHYYFFFWRPSPWILQDVTRSLSPCHQGILWTDCRALLS